MSRWIKIAAAVVLFTSLAISATTQAQIAPRRDPTQPRDRFTMLEDRLINRLRAVKFEQQAYIRRLVNLVRNRRLQERMVTAIEKKSLEKRPVFPFPYFEQAIKFEGAKRGVVVLTVAEFEHAQANLRR